MQTINIKPLSVNQARQGRRFKSKKYLQYGNILKTLIKKEEVPYGPLEIIFVFGVSSPLSDWDNMIKPAQDLICSKFGIDDKRIFRGIVEKKIVKKGQEFIQFEIRKFEKHELSGF